jgi:F420-0:gamma-glutamyl ligase
MEFLKVKTRLLMPPKDDLLAVLDEFLPKILDGDILLIATKVLAIHQGRCTNRGGTDKLKLIGEEADCISEKISDPCLTIKGNTLIPNSGIDESNGNGYYVLWPQNVENLLREIHRFVVDKFHLSSLGVISVDSCVLPMRSGTVGISQGSFGFVPVVDLVGQRDLFGRPLGMSKINVSDALAGIMPLIAGEGGEACPVVIGRGIGGISFSTEGNQIATHLIDRKTDLFGDLLKFFHKK